MKDVRGKEVVNFVDSLSNLLQPLICLDTHEQQAASPVTIKNDSYKRF